MPYLQQAEWEELTYNNTDRNPIANLMDKVNEVIDQVNLLTLFIEATHDGGSPTLAAFEAELDARIVNEKENNHRGDANPAPSNGSDTD